MHIIHIPQIMEIQNLELQHDLIKEKDLLTATFNKNNITLTSFNELKPFIIKLQEQNT